MTVRVGVLGAGFIGRIHALNLRRDDRVLLVGIADVVPRAAGRLAAGGGGGRRGAARAAPGVYQLGLNRRFARVYRFVKTLIDDGRLSPLLAQMKHNRGELQQPPWTGDPTITGGYLYETPVHLFDMGRFLFGDVAEGGGVARRDLRGAHVLVLSLRTGGGLRPAPDGRDRGTGAGLVQPRDARAGGGDRLLSDAVRGQVGVRGRRPPLHRRGAGGGAAGGDRRGRLPRHRTGRGRLSGRAERGGGAP